MKFFFQKVSSVKFNLPSSLTRCPVAKSWDITSGGKLWPLDEIDVEVLEDDGWMVILSEKQNEEFMHVVLNF